MNHLYTYLKIAALVLGFWIGLRYAHADDLGLRYNNYVNPYAGLFDFVPQGQKLLEAKYDWEPYRFFYLESAAGEFFQQDFNSGTSLVSEVSPGVRVQAGPVIVKLSQGLIYMPFVQGESSVQFITHFGLSLEDPVSKVSIGLERTHISNGNSSSNAAMDFTGLTIGARIF